MLTRLLSYKLRIIHSDMKQNERAQMTREFNDSNSDVQMLLTSYAYVSTKLNLHEFCSYVMLMKSAKNYNSELQIIYRVHCIEQKKKQKM
ncbi:hypothetical protein FQN54_001363 [Arachnomyces sp. PD_36]|nr:hypothetical protein FQN54_001363 [Arachnomyces sp. PD_36]